MKKYSDIGVGFHKGYNIYVGFMKWRISRNYKERPERFTTYFDATAFIDKYLLGNAVDINKFVAHADVIKPMKMKRIYLTTVGFKQIETNVIISVTFYVSYGDYLLLVPFVFLKHGKVIRKGVNLFNFLRDNSLIKIKEIFKKEVTILNGKITKNNLTIYDCSEINWKELLNRKLTREYFENRKSCPLDN